MSNLLLMLGCVNTTDFIGNGIRAILQNTRQLTSCATSPDLVAKRRRGDSALRFACARSPPHRAIATCASERCPIRRGETLAISIAGANRDDGAHPKPDRFDIERADIPHLAFGAGRACLPRRSAGAHGRHRSADPASSRSSRSWNSSPRGWEFASVPEFRRMKYFWIRT